MALLDHDGGAEFPHSRDVVFDALVQAIHQTEGIKIEKSDRFAGRISAQAGVTAFSWGETIPITLTETAQGATRVSIVSTPKTGVMFGGALDMGKNRRNIERLLSATSAVLATKPRAMSPTAPCPFCAESIKRAAIVCRFCSRDLPEAWAAELPAADPTPAVAPQPYTCMVCGTAVPPGGMCPNHLAGTCHRCGAAVDDAVVVCDVCVRKQMRG